MCAKLVRSNTSQGLMGLQEHDLIMADEKLSEKAVKSTFPRRLEKMAWAGEYVPLKDSENAIIELQTTEKPPWDFDDWLPNRGCRLKGGPLTGALLYFVNLAYSQTTRQQPAKM